MKDNKNIGRLYNQDFEIIIDNFPSHLYYTIYHAWVDVSENETKRETPRENERKNNENF